MAVAGGNVMKSVKLTGYHAFYKSVAVSIFLISLSKSIFQSLV